MSSLSKRKFSARTRAGAFYFFFLAAIGSIGPFLYLAYRQHGLTASEIGVAIAVAHLMNFIAGPLWGSASDVLQRRGGPPLLAVACLGAGPSILLLQTARRLAPTLIAVAIWSFFAGSIFPQADAAILTLLGKEQNAYGRVRVWGSVGFVIASLLVGQLGDRLGLDVLFPIYAAMLFLCALLAFTFPRVSIEVQPPLRSAATTIMREPRITLFLLSVLLLSMAYMAWYGTLSLHLDDLGAGTGLIGAVIALSSLTEIPVVAASSWWLGRLEASRIITVALGGFVVLWLGYSSIVQPEMALLLSVLQGLSNGLYLVAGVIYVGKVAPPGYAGLAQGTFSGISRGLGPIIGSIIGGAIFQSVGGASLYRLCALVGMLALGCLLWLSLCRNLDVRAC